MIRAALCGGRDLVAAAAMLGLVDEDPAELVLVDVRHPLQVARAASYPHELPRVIVADAQEAVLLRAAGLPHVAGAVTPEILGPLVAASLPPRTRRPLRQLAVAAARGGVGRTLLVSNLARRLGRRSPIWVVDATGTGAAAWWLHAEPGPWSDLEPLARELELDHLRVVAAEPQSGVRVLGGAGPSPGAALLAEVVTVLADADELVLVDAPLLTDLAAQQALAAAGVARRLVVVSYDDPVSLAALAAHSPRDAWIVASQCERIPGHDTFRALPRDEAAVAEAMGRRSAVRGRLGRAYDDLAELAAIDAS